MTTISRPPLDFTVIREDWCRYDLEDNAVLKVKLILTKVSKTGIEYQAAFQTVTVVLSNERGEATIKPLSSQELQASIIKDHLRFTTIAQDWNEYLLDDGARIKIQPIVMRVAKTSKFDKAGEPIYWIETQGTLQIIPLKA